MYVLANILHCKYIRVLSEIFSASPSKDIKTFFIKELCGHTASYTVQRVATGNPVHSYLSSTLDKAHHGPVMAPFSVKILNVLQAF